MRKRTRGQTIVEFALALPVIVLVVIGGIQLLVTLNLSRHAHAAAEDAVNLAAVYGGDTQEFRDQLPAILATYRLPEDTSITVDPAQANYLQPLTVRVDTHVIVRVYGLFEVPIPLQEARALSQKDWQW